MSTTRPIVVKPTPRKRADLCECGHDLIDHAWSFACGAPRCTVCPCVAFKSEDEDGPDGDDGRCFDPPYEP